MLAKLFGDSGNQVLVKRGIDNECNPEIRIYFEVEGIGVGEMAFKYEDSDEGRKDADNALEITTEELARDIIKDLKAQIMASIQNDPAN